MAVGSEREDPGEPVLPRALPERVTADGPPLLASNPLPLIPWQREATDGPGGQIGRYVVIKEIGAGGMGLVLAAYDADLERKVALKILRERARDGTAGAVRMRREAQAMARLSHPNVAQVYEVAEDRDGRLFLAMEFIEGQTLREWLAAQPRTWREVLKVYVEAGRGLAAAHAAGLMHRDFKPETWSLSRTAPLPPTGRILKRRGDLRGGQCCGAARRDAGLATVWQRAARLRAPNRRCRGAAGPARSACRRGRRWQPPRRRSSTWSTSSYCVPEDRPPGGPGPVRSEMASRAVAWRGTRTLVSPDTGGNRCTPIPSWWSSCRRSRGAYRRRGC